MDNDLSLTFTSIGVAAVVLVVAFGGLWLWAVRGGRISWVDIAWGLGFPVIALVAVVVGSAGDPDDLTRWLLLAMAAVWGVRLAVHNGRRLARHDTEDPRYQELIDDAKTSRTVTTLTKVVLPQAGAMLVVSLPLTVGANNRSHFLPLSIVGVVVWTVGVFFEAVGDAQLERFKKQKTDDDEVLDTGLWRYTRHPNYFGDVANWWGMWLVAAYSWPGLVSAVGPALMTYTIIAKTGSKMSEKKMGDSKPGYAEYVERTSSFLPLPPRRKADA